MVPIVLIVQKVPSFKCIKYILHVVECPSSVVCQRGPCLCMATGRTSLSGGPRAYTADSVLSACSRLQAAAMITGPVIRSGGFVCPCAAECNKWESFAPMRSGTK